MCVIHVVQFLAQQWIIQTCSDILFRGDNVKKAFDSELMAADFAANWKGSSHISFWLGESCVRLDDTETVLAFVYHGFHYLF